MGAERELQNCIYELNKIIGELEAIANGIEGDFCGIGEKKICDALMGKAARYKISKSILEELKRIEMRSGSGGSR